MSANSRPWIFAGLAASLPNIEPETSNKTKIAKSTNPADGPPPCKILQLSDSQTQSREVTPSEAQETIGFEPQVLVFRYRNKFHAVNHSCPHRTHPLSRGSLYDIEDFGMILSTGITCTGHGWAFEVNTGLCDRGSYKLKIWDVETREGNGQGEEIWIREKRNFIG